MAARKHSSPVGASRALAASVVTTLVAGLLAWLPAPIASAEPLLTLTFAQETGLGNFDIVTPGQTLQPGQDSSPTDDIIRTNDVITYTFNAGTPVGQSLSVNNPTVQITIPRGEQFVNLVNGQPSYTDTKGVYNVVAPAFCLDNSGIAYSTLPGVPNPNTMPAPDDANLTATSWQNLPQQTLTCHINSIPSGDGFGMTLYTKVRPEVPHGTVLGPVTVTINGSNIAPETTEPLFHTVSAGSKWDLSFNGSLAFPADMNKDFVKQNTEQMCTHNYGTGSGSLISTPTGIAQQMCYVGGFGVTLSQPNAGLGGTAMQGGNFGYTIDLSPETIWNRPAFSNKVATGKSIWETVQDYNLTVPANQRIILPGGYVTSNYGGTGWVYMSANSNLFPSPEAQTTIDNSVRKSGDTQLDVASYQPGVSATYRVSGADTTAYTVPTHAGAPANMVLWPERGYVYTSRVFIEIPLTEIQKNFAFFDAIDADGASGSMRLRIRLEQDQSSLTYTSVPGLSPVETNSYNDVDHNDNNYRTMSTGFVNDLGVRNQWMSPAAQGDDPSTPTFTEGPSTATSPSRYWPGNPAAYGPPGEAAIYKGDGVSTDGQPILSSLIIEGRTYNGGGTLMCQAFDNTKVVIDPAVAASTTSGGLQVQHIAPTQFPRYSDVDNGGAAWIYGSMYQYIGATQEAATGNLASQFGMADRYTDFQVRYGKGVVGDQNCLQPITWYTAEQINAGVDGVTWADINKTEVYIEILPGGNVAEIRTNVAIGMRVLDNTPGTLIETDVNRIQQWFGPRYGGLDTTTIPNGSIPLGDGLNAGIVRAAAYPINPTLDPNPWRLSAYDAATNIFDWDTPATLQGDRLTHIDMLARVDKKVQSHLGTRPYVDTDLWTPSDSHHVATQPLNATDISAEYQPLTAPPIYGPGSTFSYLLTPTLDANPMPAPGTMRRDVLVEDCLPVSIRLDPAQTLTLNGWTPWLAGSTLPYAKTPMTCAPGETYIGFYQPQVDVTVPLGQIVLPVYVLGTTMSGPLINQSEISLMSSSLSPTSDADPSLFTQRSDRVRIEIQAPDGLRVAKSTTTPLIFVDPLLNVSSPNVVWEIEARNINSGRVISNVDMIDYLPESGLNGSNYLGTRAFISATVVEGTNVELYYTKAIVSPKNRPALHAWSDPASASNQAGGSTVWCNADNSATYPAGGNLSQCPQSPSEVTGLRIVRPGVFANQDSFKVEVLMSAENRVDEKTPANSVKMINEVTMRAEGLDVPLYSTASALWVNRDVPPNPGTISGYVWDDFNNNGIKDDGEPPIAGVKVTATGVPMWCAEMFTNPAFVCPEVTLTAVTDANGSYVIVAYPGLLVDPNGSPLGPRQPYRVDFTTPDGYTVTVRQPAVTGGSLAPSTTVELNATTQFVTDINAGYFKPGTLAMAKSVVDAVSGQPVATAIPGQQLKYTVTVTNTSPDRYFTAQHPAAFVDSMANVLDAGTLIGSPSASSGTPAVVGSTLTWAGPLDPGASATITYTVAVDGTIGDFATNVAVAVPAGPLDPDTGLPPVSEDTGVPLDPTTGDPNDPTTWTPTLPTDPTTGNPTVPAPADCVAPACATTTTPMAAPDLAIAKTATLGGSPAESGQVGDVVSYEVTITNRSSVLPYTAANPATFVDDLSRVLDDATLNGTPTASAGAVTVVGSRLVWAGPLAPGASVTVRYTVVLNGEGSLAATNVAFVTQPGPLDPTTGQPVTPGGGTPPTPTDCVAPLCAQTTTLIIPPVPAVTTTTLPPATTQPPATIPPDSQLPRTGSDPRAVALIAITLIGLGVVFLRLRRRRTA